MPARDAPHELRPASQVHLSHDWKAVPSTYVCFENAAVHYPAPHEWLSFDRLWAVNAPYVLSSNGGDTYLEHYVREGIVSVAQENALDARLVLAAMMQRVCGKSSHGTDSLNLHSSQSAGKVPEYCKNSPALCGRLHATAAIEAYTAGMQGENIIHMIPGTSSYASDVANRLLGWAGKRKSYETC